MAEQEREELIELARQAIDPDRPESYDPTMIAERIVDADWRPPPSGDVVEQVAKALAGGPIDEPWPEDVPRRWIKDYRDHAQALAAAGLLRAPVGQDETDTTEPEFDAMFNEATGVETVARVFVDGREVQSELVDGPPGEYVSIPVPPPDELVETIAKTIFGVPPWLDGGMGERNPWNRLREPTREEYRRQATDVLRALGEATDGD